MSLKCKFYSVAIVSVLVIVMIAWHYNYGSIENIKVKVADINKGVYVSLCKVNEPYKTGCDEYRNEDSPIFHFKIDSGKVRSRLAMAEKSEEVVNVKVYGYRIPFFSVRKNILDVVE